MRLSLDLKLRLGSKAVPAGPTVPDAVPTEWSAAQRATAAQAVAASREPSFDVVCLECDQLCQRRIEEWPDEATLAAIADAHYELTPCDMPRLSLVQVV